MADQFDAAIANVNRQYDDQIRRLEGYQASGNAGINQTGADVLKQLSALNADARLQNRRATAHIGDVYGGANREVNNAYNSLFADLQRQGAGTGGLAQELAARMSSLRSSGAADKSLSSRYTQLLGQAMNERQGLAKQTTANALNDVTRSLMEAKFKADQAKQDALYQIEQQRRAAAAAAAAAARRSRGGGGGGSSGNIPESLLTAIRKAKGSNGRLSVKELDKIARDTGVFGQYSGNTALAHKTGQRFIEMLASGKYSPERALQQFRGESPYFLAGNGTAFDPTPINNFLRQAANGWGRPVSREQQIADIINGYAEAQSYFL